MGSRSAVLIVVLVFGVLFFMIYFSNAITQQPDVAIVRILDGLGSEDNSEFLDPQVVTVVIGLNNTIR